MTESAGKAPPRMGRWNVATGGVRLRRTEPVVVLVYVTAPMGRGKRRLLLFKCLLGPSRAAVSVTHPGGWVSDINGEFMFQSPPPRADKPGDRLCARL